MGYEMTTTAKMARLDEALRRMFASCPAPRRLRLLAEEFAALRAADGLAGAWPTADQA